MGGDREDGRSFDALQAFKREKVRQVQHSVCSCAFLWLSLKTVGLVLFYYSFSISLTFYNQRFIHAFRFPLSITLVHLFTKFVLAGIVRSILFCKTKEARVTLGWCDYIKSIAPPGVTSSLDIGLSNWSFEFITISLYTMTKSTVIVFILIFSLLFHLEKLRCSLVVVVLFIAAGLFLFTFQSTQFVLEGFLMVLAASFLSGLRWTLAQVILQRSQLGLENPIDMMYHIQPWMALTLLPLAGVFEGLSIATSVHLFAFHDVQVLLQTMGLLALGAGLAFMLEYSEFLLLSQTSSLTLSISGIFKEICTLYLAVELNGDKMSPINAAGLLVCLLGITVHVITKAVQGREDKIRSEVMDESVSMLLLNGEANDDTDEDEVDLFNVRRDR